MKKIIIAGVIVLELVGIGYLTFKVNQLSALVAKHENILLSKGGVVPFLQAVVNASKQKTASSTPK